MALIPKLECWIAFLIVGGFLFILGFVGDGRLHKRHTERKKESTQDRSSRRTATATVWIAVFAVVAAIVGVSQAIIANRQLTAMQGQLDEMHTASSLTKAQMRANIRILQFNPEIVQGKGWKVTPVWHNSGSTNADEFEQWSSIKLFIPDVPSNFDFSKPADALGPTPKVAVGPNSPIQGGPAFISDADVQKVASGIGTVYLWGHADYRDIFFPETKLHNTNHCSKVVFSDLKNPSSVSFLAYRAECNYAN